MGLINRFLLLLYALAVAAAAVGVAALCFGVVPRTFVLEQAAFWLSRWETVGGAVIVFLASLYVIVTCVFHREAKPDKEKEAVVIRSETGEVRVAVPAVAEMAEKIASKIYGVESVSANVSSTPPKANEKGSSSVVVGLQVGINDGHNVAAISDAIRTTVSEHMAKTLGFTGCAINISVTEIAEEVAAKKPRVS